MSQTVHYKGKANLVDLNGLTNEEFAEKFIKAQGRVKPSYSDSSLEYLTDRWGDLFFFYPRNQFLYEITLETINEDEEIIKAEFDSASEGINYELRYYNGGAGFEECLEEAFDKIIK